MINIKSNGGHVNQLRAYRHLRTPQTQTPEAPLIGADAAERAKERIVYVNGAYGDISKVHAVKITYKKRRHVDLDFTYLAQAAAQNGAATHVPSSVSV